MADKKDSGQDVVVIVVSEGEICAIMVHRCIVPPLGDRRGLPGVVNLGTFCSRSFSQGAWPEMSSLCLPNCGGEPQIETA